MTILKGYLKDVAGQAFQAQGTAVVLQSRIIRPAENGGGVILRELYRIPMYGTGGKFTTPELDPGPIRVEINGGVSHGEHWDIDLPASGTHDLADLIGSTVEWTPVVVARAEAAARAASSAADRAEAGANRVGSAQAVLDAATSVKLLSDQATASSTSASTSAKAAATSATNAKTSETNAASSKTAAATSATNAKTSETNAKTSETNAAASGDAASGSATAAKASEVAAADSKSAAAVSATNAKTSETNAGKSASAAAGSATAAKSDADRAKGEADRAATITASGVADATSTTKGKLALSGDLAGTADKPTVPGLAGKADKTHTHDLAGLTGQITNAQLPAIQVLGNNVDLNTLETTGSYHQAGNAGAASGKNYPSPNAGLLQVINPPAAMVYQMYTVYSSGAIFYRGKYNTTWSGWKEISTQGHTHPTSQVDGLDAALGTLRAQMVGRPAFFFGAGAPPASIPGAAPGDVWWDTTTGNVHKITGV